MELTRYLPRYAASMQTNTRTSLYGNAHGKNGMKYSDMNIKWLIAWNKITNLFTLATR